MAKKQFYEYLSMTFSMISIHLRLLASKRHCSILVTSGKLPNGKMPGFLYSRAFSFDIFLSSFKNSAASLFAAFLKAVISSSSIFGLVYCRCNPSIFFLSSSIRDNGFLLLHLCRWGYIKTKIANNKPKLAAIAAVICQHMNILYLLKIITDNYEEQEAKLLQKRQDTKATKTLNRRSTFGKEIGALRLGVSFVRGT